VKAGKKEGKLEKTKQDICVLQHNNLGEGNNKGYSYLC
jgi:hypothetical protein